MAALRKRGNRWQVQIRKSGMKPLTKSFLNKKDAQVWALTTETQIEQRTYQDTSVAESLPFSSILDRYENEIVPKKKGKRQFISQLNTLRRSNLYKLHCAHISPADIAEYRDARLRSGITPQTVRKDLSMLHRLFIVVQNEWHIDLPKGNPVNRVSKPTLTTPTSRNRRLEHGELAILLNALTHTSIVQQIVQFACETAMRRSEIVGINWEHINFEKRLLHIPVTKTNTPRTIPLTAKAIDILKCCQQNSTNQTERVFPITANSVTQAFIRACKRSQSLHDLRFHDLRHEATSRFFEKGLTPMQVASITGHKDFQMLNRYTHLRAEDIANLI